MNRLKLVCVMALFATSGGCVNLPYMSGQGIGNRAPKLYLPGANGMPDDITILRNLTPGQLSRIGDAYWGLTCEGGQLMMSAWQDYEARKLVYGPVNMTQKASEDGVVTKCEDDPRFEPSKGRMPAWRPRVPKGSGGESSDRDSAFKPNPLPRGSGGAR